MRLSQLEMDFLLPEVSFSSQLFISDIIFCQFKMG
jgi:hypothetical protein